MFYIILIYIVLSYFFMTRFMLNYESTTDDVGLIVPIICAPIILPIMLFWRLIKWCIWAWRI